MLCGSSHWYGGRGGGGTADCRGLATSQSLLGCEKEGDIEGEVEFLLLHANWQKMH